MAEEFIEKKAHEGLAEPTLEKMRRFVKLLGTDFGKCPVTDITPQELLHELQKHERRGRLETANLLRSFASRVFRFAVATARAERDPAQLLIGALTTPRVKHFTAIIDPIEFGALRGNLRVPFPHFQRDHEPTIIPTFYAKFWQTDHEHRTRQIVDFTV
ncbi:tyrosine-type recombinase/integrase [Sphingobium aquiterrae]|uniref:tyrosine-type recombinase/integrase n=1 Tax=Sphingobium aquiterrae TaxID=2038656 RepID=UPI003AFA1562